MRQTVFYSWQSDLPNATNRGLIQRALEQAAEQINAEAAVDPAERDEVEIDKDTAGVAGAPDIAATILAKIKNADVFVADASFIGGPEDKRTPNPNVLIELGYALQALGSERVLLVFNEAFGNARDLPFDIRGKKCITYTCHPDDERAAARKELASRLVPALRLALASAPERKQTPDERIARLKREALADRVRQEILEREGQQRGHAAAMELIKLVTERGSNLLGETYKFQVTVAPQEQPYAAFQVSAYRLVVEWTFSNNRVQYCRMENTRLLLHISDIDGNFRRVAEQYWFTVSREKHEARWWNKRSRDEKTFSNTDLVEWLMDHLAKLIDARQNHRPEAPRRVAGRVLRSSYLDQD